MRFIKCLDCNGEKGEEVYLDDYLHWWEDCPFCDATGKMTLRGWLFYKFEDCIPEWWVYVTEWQIAVRKKLKLL